MLSQLSNQVKQYLVITTSYWAFTLTDGALRMLVVLYFHQLGYAPLQIAFLFLFYEFFGVVTNLVGGWLGARYGLNKTMHIGLSLQVVALAMLVLPDAYLSVTWVMAAQALSGIAKDLNKMSAKSSIKYLVNDTAQSQSPLFKWVALLTGSKNALKGIGFFLGGFLLSTCGFQQAMLVMALALLIVLGFSVVLLKQDLGKAKNKAKFSALLSKSASLNYLSTARLFLFAARDVWFVIALPVFLVTQLGWQQQSVGAFLALWVIGYGIVQAKTPTLINRFSVKHINGKLLAGWALALSFVTAAIFIALNNQFAITTLLTLGLMVFGAVFAVNSSLHSYKVVAMANEDGVSMDVGFYYMANAAGRLFGTVLSGWVFQVYGFAWCLLLSCFLTLLSAMFIRKI